MSDDEWETDEEENIVVKLCGGVSEEGKKKLLEGNEDILIMGLDEETPVLQIGNELYRGNYSHPIGTNLVLRETPTNTDLEYLCVSDKQLEMKKLFLQKKQQAQSGDSNQTENSTEPGREQIVTELVDLTNTGSNEAIPPREITQTITPPGEITEVVENMET